MLIDYFPYVFAIIIITLIMIFTYLRVKYGFWYYQPVHHIFNLKYYFFPPGIIREHLPEKNKFTNFKEIETKPFNKLTKLEITQFTNFIKINFFRNGDNEYNPTKENIIPYFIGFTQPCYFSFFREDSLLIDTKENNLISDKKLIAVMTGRPLKVYLNDTNSQSIFDVYYIDYLCVHMDYRKKGTAPQIIQTHEYNQRHNNKNISVSLFKREGELTGIMPICVYNMYCFESSLWKKPVISLHSSYKIVETNKQNSHLLFDYIKESNKLFELCVIPEVSNILELIKTGNIYIYFLLRNDNIHSVYFFRKSCTYIEKNKEGLTLFASINTCNNNDIFFQGFKMAYWEIVKKNDFYSYAVIEDISHSKIIIQNLILHWKPEITMPAAYFFYNFAYKTFDNYKVLMIN